jgi:putative RecB family exonuclease
VSEKPHLSVTQIRMYLRCPLQYFFRYVCDLKIPPGGDMMLGRTIHSALQENYQQKIESHQDLPLDHVTDFFSDRWEQDTHETHFSPDENSGKLKDQGIGLLTAYQKQISPRIQPVEVEREFLVDTGKTDLPLKGYIDLIDDQGFIIDHKTSKRSYQSDAAEKDIQLTAYALAYRQLFGQEEKGVRLDAMIRNKQPKIQQLSATRTQDEIGRFARLAGQVENAIRKGVYYPNDNYMCGNCGYNEMCKKW